MAGKFSIEGVLRLTDRLTRPLTRVESRVGRFARRSSANMRKLDKSFMQSHRTISRVGLGLAAFGVSAALALGHVGKAGADFEQAITDVGAVGLQTRAQIKPLEDLALQLGATTKFTATQSAAAMELMARSGFSNAQIIAGVGGVLDAAAASGLEMAEVAGYVSDALKGFQLDASQATRVADVLALASSKTNSTIGSLGESLSNVASTARELKVPFEQTVAAVALLQDVGLDASVAGSALNTMMTKLAKPPAAIAKQMKKFGVSFKDAKGNMLPFQDVLANISKAAEKSGGNMDRVAFLADLVGLRGQKAASNLATLFESGKVTELTAQLDKAGGSARKMADLKMDTLTGDITLLESAVDGVKVSLFDLNGGPLRGVVQGMTEWVTKNNELITSGVGDFITDFKDALPTIIKWLRAIGASLAVFYAYAAAIKAATVLTAVFNAVLALNPLGMIALAVAALAVLMYTFWPEITELAKDAWSWIEYGWHRLTISIGAGLFKIKQWWGAASDFISDVWTSAIDSIKGYWTGFASWIGELWGSITTKASEWATAVGTAIAPIGRFFSDLWQGIADTFHNTIGWLFEAISKAVGDVQKLGGISIGNASEAASAGSSSSSASDAQAIGPHERAAAITSQSFSETMSTEKNFSEVVIRDESGKASMPRRPKRGSGISFEPTGAY